MNSDIREHEDKQLQILISKVASQRTGSLMEKRMSSNIKHQQQQHFSPDNAADNEAAMLAKMEPSLLKSHINENSEQYTQIKQSVESKDSKKIVKEIIRRNSTVIQTPFAPMPPLEPPVAHKA